MYSVHIIQAELDINPELILNKQTSIGVVLSWFYSFLFLIFSAVHFVHFEHAHDCIRKLVFDITQLKLHHRRVHTHTHCTFDRIQFPIVIDDGSTVLSLYSNHFEFIASQQQIKSSRN